MTCQTSCIHAALLSLSALEWRTRNGPPHSIHSQTPPPQAPSPSICLAMREKREWEREKKQWGVLMTIDLQVWVGSLPLIRLRWRPMGGPSLPPLLLHFLLVLAPSLMSWTQVPQFLYLSLRLARTDCCCWIKSWQSGQSLLTDADWKSKNRTW